MAAKFELTSETKILSGKTLFRIRATIDFCDVKKGDLGGFVEKEKNLAQDGDAWVCGDARVYGNARVFDNAQVACFTGVGSERRTLTAFINKDGGVTVVRGCFVGSLDNFECRVAERHGDNQFAQEYRALIAFIRVRFAEYIAQNQAA